MGHWGAARGYVLDEVTTLFGLSFSVFTAGGAPDHLSGPHKQVELYLEPEQRPPGLGTCGTQATEGKTVSLT